MPIEGRRSVSIDSYEYTVKLLASAKGKDRLKLYVASANEFPGIVVYGRTHEDALLNMKKTVSRILADCRRFGNEIPVPASENE